MFEIVVEFVLVVVGNLTGHAVLWAVTLGRWRLFDRLDQESDAATLVGLLFWVAAAAVVWAAFFR